MLHVGEKRRDRAIGFLLPCHRHQLVQVTHLVVHRHEPVVVEQPMFTVEGKQLDASGTHQVERGRRLPMHKLGTELDRTRFVLSLGVDAAAGPVASVEDDHASACLREVPRHRQARGAGADHGDFKVDHVQGSSFGHEIATEPSGTLPAGV